VDTPEPRLDTYNAACLMANAADTAAKEKGVDEEQRRKLADGYADRAVKLLQKAAQAGYGASYEDRVHMDKDSDLDPLRQRADFKAVLARLDERLPSRPMTPAREYEDLARDYGSARASYRAEYNAARTAAERKRAVAAAPAFEQYAGRFLDLAEKYPDHAAALDALTWVLEQTEPDPDRPQSPQRTGLRRRALEVVKRDHLKQQDLTSVCRALGQAGDPAGDELLKVIMAEHKEDKMRGIAGLALALSRSAQSERWQSSAPVKAKQ